MHVMMIQDASADLSTNPSLKLYIMYVSMEVI